jgi:hypothetical protein
MFVDHVSDLIFGNKRGDQSRQVEVHNYRILVYADDAGNRGAQKPFLSLEREAQGVVGSTLGGFFNCDVARKLAVH